MTYQSADILYLLLCLLTVQSLASVAAPTTSTSFMAPSRSGGESSSKCWSQRELRQCWYRQQGMAGASGHLALHFPSSLKAPVARECFRGWCDSFHCYCSTLHLEGFSTPKVRALTFSSALTPCCSLSTSQAFPAELIQPAGAWPAQLHPLVPRGTFPSPWPHPAQGTRISARCRTVWWLQAAGDVLIPESRVHIAPILKQGELWNTGSTSGQLLESIRREKLSPSGPCCLASQHPHFYLQPRHWCFVSVCLCCAPGQSCGHSACTEGGCQGSCPAQGWQAGATAAWVPGAAAGSHGCRSSVHPPRPPAVPCTAQAQAQWTGKELISWLVCSCLRNTGFLVCITTKPDCFRDIKVSWVSDEFLQGKGKAAHLTASFAWGIAGTPAWGL